MSLRDRLNKLNTAKLAEAASKPAAMTEDNADKLLSSASTSNAQRVAHERPLEALLKQAVTMKTEAPTKAVPMDKPVSAPAPMPEVAKATKKLTLAERLAARKSAETKPATVEATPPVEKKLSLAERLAAAKAPSIKKDGPITVETHGHVPAPSDGMDFTKPIAEGPQLKKMSLAERLAAAKPKPAPKLMSKEEASSYQEMLAPKPKKEEVASEPADVPKKAMSLAERLAAMADKTPEPKPESKPSGAAEAAHQGLAIKHEQASITMPTIKLVQEEGKAPQRVASQVAEVDTPELADNRAMVALNERQQAGVDATVAGESFCVVGPAGTGKTTYVRSAIKALKDNNRLRRDVTFKRQGGSGLQDRVDKQWSVACVAFTRTAANNLRGSITADPELADFYYSCQTIHNLLEYHPEQIVIVDDETGEEKETMRFVPDRDADYPLDLDVLFIEEASMVDLGLAEKLMAALPSHCQIIYLGDINQLPPVFGLPILAYALHKLRVIELTHVYRQAIGPVLNAAHNILEGRMPKEDVGDRGVFNLYHEYTTPAGGISLKQHNADKGKPVSVGPDRAAKMYSKMFELFFAREDYDPEQDMILSPWNKQELGIVSMNQYVAQFVGDARKAVVHEVKAGFALHYLAVGDIVMVDKQKARITEINGNADYIGNAVAPAGNDLSRFGVRLAGREGSAAAIDLDAMEDSYSNFSLDTLADQNVDEIKRAASHCVTVELDTGEQKTLGSAGDFAPDKFSLGYVLTGHKAQGMEWRKVWIIAHRSQGATLQREWLYTCVTRTKVECTILGHADVIQSALKRQRIKGDTLEQKIDSFTGAVDNLEEVRVVACA